MTGTEDTGFTEPDDPQRLVLRSQCPLWEAAS